MRSPLLIGLLGAVLLGPLLTLAPVATAAEPRPRQGSVALVYAEVAHRVTNLRRVGHDLGRLRKQSCLQRRALEQARAIARRGELFHQDLDRVQRRCGMGWVGENVAFGFSSGRQVVRAWMRSPGHRANILNRHFRRMGIAAVRRDGVWWVAQVFGTKA